MRRVLPNIGLLVIAGLWQVIAAADPLFLLESSPSNVLGQYASSMRETGSPLTVDEAVAAEAAGKFTAGGSPVLNFGIGGQPVWIHLPITNPTDQRLDRRLLIENPWLDKLDVYFKSHRGVAGYRVGDSRPFAERPIRGRFFAFDHDFDVGTTDIYLRVETADPVVVPIFLVTPADAMRREIAQGYSYGLVYGFLLALLAYNTILYLGLRDTRYLRYAAFLTMFVLTNLAYTGHGFAWLWPEHVSWQRWIIPVLMVLFGTSGLTFATDFLDTRSNFPRAYKIGTGMCGLFIGLLTAAVWADSQHYAILVAFVFVTIFSFTMLVLGVMSLYSGYQLARYFLIASIASMLGTAVTSLTVWGYLPFSDWTFRAVEIGMLVDATLLALALAQQFRANQAERLLAEQRAGSDPLTGLNNRRAFLEKSQSIWSTALRSGRNVSVIVFDIDHFKSINDRYGHTKGDTVLVETAKALAKSAREGDVVARWGGEEFLLLLPETNLKAASTLAERLRNVIAGIRLPLEDGAIGFTASFGVIQRIHQETLDSLISDADGLMYQAKKLGRNRVCYAKPQTVD